MKAVNRLMNEAKTQAAGDPTHEVLKFSPFIEQMGTPAGRTKEFWCEREWRHIGDFVVTLSDVVAVMAPANQHGRLEPDINGLNWAGRKPPS